MFDGAFYALLDHVYIKTKHQVNKCLVLNSIILSLCKMSFSVLLPACRLPDHFIANFEHINSNIQYFKPFMQNIVKWSNIPCKSLRVHTVTFLKHI